MLRGLTERECWYGIKHQNMSTAGWSSSLLGWMDNPKYLLWVYGHCWYSWLLASEQSEWVSLLIYYEFGFNCAKFWNWNQFSVITAWIWTLNWIWTLKRCIVEFLSMTFWSQNLFRLWPKICELEDCVVLWFMVNILVWENGGFDCIFLVFFAPFFC